MSAATGRPPARNAEQAGPAPAAPANPWPPLVIAAIGFFMVLLDATIVNVAIPTMLASLHATFDQILWVINAYLLVLAALLITAGRAGDIWGPRNLFIAGLVVFTAASALCGLSQDAGQLIGARVVQGAGAAMLSPQILVIASSLFPPERRGTALGVVASVTALATIAGPAAGGAIVTWGDWRWVFFINIPIGVIALAGAAKVVPDLRPGRRHRLDLAGAALATAGLLAIVFGLIEGQRYNWGTITGTALTIPGVMAAGAVLLAAFLFWQRVAREPLLPLALFTRRDYSLATLLAGLSFFATFGFALCFTIVTQSVLGLTPIQAGLTFLPMAIVMAATAPQAGRLTDRFGGRALLIAGPILMAAGLAALAVVIAPSSTWLTFALPLACYGLGMGLLTAPSLAVAMNDVTPALAGPASGLYNTARQVGGAIGAAVVGAVLSNQLVSHLRSGAAAAALQLPPPARDRFTSGFASAGRTGLQVGRGQAGGPLPAGLPAAAASQARQLAHDVFVSAFVHSMRPALAVPAILMLLGALCATRIAKRSPHVTPAPAQRPDPRSGAALRPAQPTAASPDAGPSKEAD